MVQPKLTVGAANDPYEREARTGDPSGSFDAGEDIARQLSATRSSGASLPVKLRSDLEPKFGAEFSNVRMHIGAQSEAINRSIGAQAFTHRNQIHMTAGKYNPGTGAGNHLQAHELKHVMKQRGAAVQRSTQPTDPDLHPNRTGLPDGLKTGIEALSGLSIDGVKVHYNSSKPAQRRALAYAKGRDIHVAPSQERHLPHEAWHVVQQAQGRVKPTMQMKGKGQINDDKGLEHEADVMGAKASANTMQGSNILAAPGQDKHPRQVKQGVQPIEMQSIPDMVSQLVKGGPIHIGSKLKNDDGTYEVTKIVGEEVTIKPENGGEETTFEIGAWNDDYTVVNATGSSSEATEGLSSKTAATEKVVEEDQSHSNAQVKASASASESSGKEKEKMSSGIEREKDASSDDEDAGRAIASSTSSHSTAAVAPTATAKERVKKTLKEGSMENVSLSSAIHWFENLNEKYDKVVTQPWGFSFAPRKTQEEDVKAINEYIGLFKAGKIEKQTHRHEGPKTIYTVNGRVYSTHADSHQLYPISGPGVIHGRGPVDMYYVLQALERDEPARVIRLYEQYVGMDEKWHKAAAEKMEGGHRSGVELPDIKTTSAGTIKKMQPTKLEAKVKEARAALEKVPPSNQYGVE